MNILQTATEKMRLLPPDKQQEVLDFIEFLQSKLVQQNQSSNIEQIEPISFLTGSQ